LPEAKIAEKEASIKLIPIEPPGEVPFRVSIVWKKIKYLDWLIDNRGLKVEAQKSHVYWHKLQIYKVEYR